MSAIKFSFVNAGLSEDDALDLADLLLKERTNVTRQAALKIREQVQRYTRAELTEDVELHPEEQTALLGLLDALPDRRMPEPWRHLRDELRKLVPS